MEIPSDWFKTAQAARKLDVTPAYIRLLMRQGRLRHATTPYGRLIDPAAIEQFSAQRMARQREQQRLVRPCQAMQLIGQ